VFVSKQRRLLFPINQKDLPVVLPTTSCSSLLQRLRSSSVSCLSSRKQHRIVDIYKSNRYNQVNIPRYIDHLPSSFNTNMPPIEEWSDPPRGTKAGSYWRCCKCKEIAAGTLTQCMNASLCPGWPHEFRNCSKCKKRYWDAQNTEWARTYKT
jgi:hypothetical protein